MLAVTTRSYLLTSPLMREIPDTAESKFLVGDDEASTAQSGIRLFIINNNIVVELAATLIRNIC